MNVQVHDIKCSCCDEIISAGQKKCPSCGTQVSVSTFNSDNLKSDVSPSAQVHDIRCSGCGEAADIGQTKCPSCGNPVLVTTFNSVFSMPMPMVNKYAAEYRQALEGKPDSKEFNKCIAFCYLKLKLYDKALAAFEKTIVDNFDDTEIYFYTAICLLGGKKAFLAQRPEIDKIEEYINAAMMIEPKGIYHYFQAYVKYDYFSRKFFNTSPTYQEALANAKAAGLSPADVDQFYGILGVERPSVL